MSLKIEKHEKIAMLAVSALNSISRKKSKTSLEKTGNIYTEASVLFNRNTTTIPTWTQVQNNVQNHVQNQVQNHVQNHVLKTVFETMFEK